MEGIARRGLMLVLSSPSGAGKTTLARRLLDDENGHVAMSISHTTRPRRRGEKDGHDYHFVDRDTFTRMRDQGEFLEWAVVFDNYYGTRREPVESALADEGTRVIYRQREIECRQLQLHPAGFDLGEVQDVVDDDHEVLS